MSNDKIEKISNYMKVNEIKTNQLSESTIREKTTKARISVIKDNPAASQIGYITMNEAITSIQKETKSRTNI